MILGWTAARDGRSSAMSDVASPPSWLYGGLLKSKSGRSLRETAG
jgi:hypothetical protein